MDKIAFIIVMTFAVIASTFIMLNMIPAMQADIGAQEKKDLDQQQQTVTIEGDCSDRDCVVDAMKECKLSETTITDASNATKIITVGGDGVYQGRSVCIITIYEENAPIENNSAASFQSWSCKVPIAELQNSTSTKSIDELVGKLVSSEHCGVQIH